MSHTTFYSTRFFVCTLVCVCENAIDNFFSPVCFTFFFSSAPFTPIMFSSVQHQHHRNRRIDFSCFSHTQLQTEETDVCVPVWMFVCMKMNLCEWTCAAAAPPPNTFKLSHMHNKHTEGEQDWSTNMCGKTRARMCVCVCCAYTNARTLSLSRAHSRTHTQEPLPFEGKKRKSIKGRVKIGQTSESYNL